MRYSYLSLTMFVQNDSVYFLLNPHGLQRKEEALECLVLGPERWRQEFGIEVLEATIQ